MYYISRISGAAALAALGVAVWFSIVLARADFYFRRSTPQTVERAIEITPRNTEYLTLRALELDYEGADSRALTEKVAALNPYSSAPRIRLGLAAELSGDAAGAERWLLDAARVDHQFEPRWTLENFYFRAGKPDEFWEWMRAALDVSYGDRTPAFDLCWRVTGDPNEILDRAIPDRHDVTASYLIFLSQKAKGLPGTARKLAAFHDASDLPLLLGVCDQLIAAHDPAALDIWQLTGHSPPSGIVNGDFATPPSNHGFDWRFVASPGVTSNGSRIALSGRQPESCSLLQQTLSLGAGTHYRLQWESRTSGIKTPSGLSWRIAGQHAALAPSENWTPGEMTFTVDDRFPLLELVYQRPLGESRAEGNVELRHVRLAP
jgi:hypothetical protein